MKHTELDTTDLSTIPRQKKVAESLQKESGVEKRYDPAECLIRIGTQNGRRDIDFTKEMDMSHVFESQTSLEAWSSTSEKVLGLFRTKQLEIRCHTPEN